MAVKVNGAPLSFEAEISLGSFQAQVDRMEQDIKKIIKKTEDQNREHQNSIRIQKEYAQIITQTGQAFKKLDQDSQGQLKTLASYTQQIRQVTNAKSTLDDRFQQGIIGVETYKTSMAALTAVEKRLSSELEKVANEVRANDAIMSAASGSINQRSALISKLRNDYSALSGADRDSAVGEGMLRNIQTLEKELTVINGKFQVVEQSATGSINQKIQNLDKLRAQYAALSDIDRKGNAGKQMAQSIRDLDKEVRILNQDFEQTSTFAQRVALAIGGFATLSAGTNFIKDIARVRGEFQQLEVAFNTMLGSKEKADKLMAEAVDLAAKTPFGLQDVGTGAKQLLAYGFAADEITGTLRRLGDVAAGVGAPLNDIVYLYGTTRTQGRLYAQDLMQFTSRGIPIIRELAKQFGVTEAEVKGLVEAGKVGFPEVEKVINSLTSSGGVFFNLMEEQSKTLTGLTANLQDAWASMLNDIGKSNEGVFASAIKGATSLVENYETVLDILKVLVATYGTYRAAIIASSVAVKVYTVSTQTLSVMQTLQATTSTLAKRAMDALNLSMLKNPAVLIAAGVGLLISQFVFLDEEIMKVKKSQDILNDSIGDGNLKYSQQEAQIKQYVDTLKNQNIAESVRLDAYNKLKEIAPDIINQLSFQTAKTSDLTDATNVYLASLRQKIQLESLQSGYAQAIEQETKAKKNLLKVQEGLKDLTGFALATKGDSDVKQAQRILEDAIIARREIEAQIGVQSGAGTRDAIQARINQLRQEMKVLEKTSLAYKENEDAIISFQKRLIEINKKGNTPKTNSQLIKEAQSLEVIDELRKRIREQYEKETDQTQRERLAKDLAFADKRRKILDIYKEDSSEQRNGEKEETKRERDLKKLKEDILKAEEDARTSGLTKNESELDKINRKYDELRARIKTLGNDPALNTRLENARVIELGNERMRQQNEAYLKNLEAQRDIFSQFEEAKKEVGIQKAKEMFGEQLKGATTYLEFLKAEQAKFQLVGVPSFFLKNTALGKEIAAEEKRAAKESLETKIKSIKEALDATKTYRIAEEEINKKYNDRAKVIKSQASESEKTERLQINEEARENELAALEKTMGKYSSIYKKLNKDISLFTKNQIRNLIRELQSILKDSNNLPPDLVKGIIAQIDRLNSSLQTTSKSAKNFHEVAQALGAVGASLGTLADQAGSVDQRLASTLSSLSSLTNVASGIATASAQFAAQDYVGGAASSIGVLTSVFQMFQAAKDSVKKVREEIQRFNQSLLTGEYEYNALLRERARIQAGINESTLVGLENQRKELENQRASNKKDTEGLLKLIQKESYTVSEEERKKRGLGLGGFLISPLVGVAGLFGRKSEVQSNQASLLGKSYAELEQLFIKGQLSEKAKELFEQLRKLKEEGKDIDQLLQDNARSIREAFTGTTSESITESIIDGFRNGYRSAADFASTFEDLMKNAVLNSLKFQALEEPLKKFYEEFANSAQSDGILTAQEVQTLRDRLNGIIGDAGKQFEELMKITNIDISGGTTGKNLQSTIKGITEQQATLLAGQFGGLRLTALEQLRVAERGLVHLSNIDSHTSRLPRMDEVLYRLERDGIKIRA